MEPREAGANSAPASTIRSAGKHSSAVPSASLIPTNSVSGGTGAAAAAVSGPCTATCQSRPSRQTTSVQCAVAIDVIQPSASLRARHTRSMSGDSDGRSSNSIVTLRSP